MVSTERVLLQANKGCLCKSISPFTMGHYGSQYDYVIHIALIATSCTSLITSFQPPLPFTCRAMRARDKLKTDVLQSYTVKINSS